MKTLILLLLLFAGVCSAQEMVAPVYPGAKNMGVEHPGVFLTIDDFHDVWNYYFNDLGKGPESERDEEDGRKSAWFVYRTDTIYYEEDYFMEGAPSTVSYGVRLDYLAGENRNVRYAIESVAFKVPGTEDIADKYDYLKYRFYPYVYDEEEGGYMCRSSYIYRKYSEIDRQKDTAYADVEADYEKNVLEAMEQGDMMRMMDLAKGMMGKSEDKLDLSHWVDCLEEMAQEYYTVRISISMLYD